jgi:chromosome segregation ATPase
VSISLQTLGRRLWAVQESRIEELRDTHRLEGSSQTELITKLRSQLSTAESTLAQKATELMSLSKMKEELAKAQTAAKEEEEKRTKAISLLKTVRLKLVKLEKEKEEIERDRAEERAERSSAKDEVERVKAEKEREVNQLRKGFERELAGAKERFEKEMQTKKAAWELEMITTKVRRGATGGESASD